jgi:hypothetical protein
VLTGYFVTAERTDIEAVLGAVAALFLSLAQRHLSTQVRTVRRRVERVDGTLAYRDGTTEELSAASLLEAPERALRALTLATITFAAALVAMHV